MRGSGSTSRATERGDRGRKRKWKGLAAASLAANAALASSLASSLAASAGQPQQQGGVGVVQGKDRPWMQHLFTAQGCEETPQSKQGGEGPGPAHQHGQAVS